MDEILKTLGLAYRARKVILGEEILNRISEVTIMFLASDLSEKNRERYEKKCFYYGIDHIDKYDSQILSAAFGKSNVKTAGVIDKGFKDAILKKL